MARQFMDRAVNCAMLQTNCDPAYEGYHHPQTPFVRPGYEDIEEDQEMPDDTVEVWRA